MQHLQMPAWACSILLSCCSLGSVFMLSSFGGTIALGGLISWPYYLECYQI
jgi:hypothetical protein